MPESWLTDDEVRSLQSSDLHRRAPYLIRGVSRTIYSVARHYGGAKIQGDAYTYLPSTDELVRDDVRKWIQKRRKAKPVDDYGPASTDAADVSTAQTRGEDAE